MRERLARKELEKKRVEDAQRLQLEDPNFRQGLFFCGQLSLFLMWVMKEQEDAQRLQLEDPNLR